MPAPDPVSRAVYDDSMRWLQKLIGELRAENERLRRALAPDTTEDMPDV